jgi:hypothetical protein
MKITSYGDSFIFGIDLADAEMIPNTAGRASQLAWPALLAHDRDWSYHCRAYPGCGNLLVAERIILDMVQLARDKPTVVVGWTWIDRFDYNDIRKIDTWETIRPAQNTAIAETYYRDLHSEYRDKLTSLMTIKLIIDTFKQNDIPFVMTYMDELLFDQRWHTSRSIEYLQNYVQPHMTQFDGMTFLDWSRSKGFEISAQSHPLESAHQAGFELIKSLDLV